MLTYDMNARGDTPLYEFLYESIANDIRMGRIPAAKRLPSKRALAKHLGVSLITVESAFSQLVAEGYVRSVERKGYYACDLSGMGVRMDSPERALRNERNDRSEHSGRSEEAFTAAFSPSRTAEASEGFHVPAASAEQVPFDMRGGSLASAFPYEAWARFLRETLSREPESALVDAKSPLGTLRLRQVLANYLREYRGMDVSAGQIVVGAGAQYLYGMIVQLLSGMCGTCHVAIENPGYPRLEKIYRVNRVPVSYISMDDQGICMDALAASAANIVHLTPSHQFPTGLVTAAPRRYELLGWAAQDAHRFIIEDDYDCEFRLAGKPIAPLQRLDVQGQVIYTNTFTKSLGGAFRIGYMVLPVHLAERFERELGFYSCSVSAVDQLALARFIESGAYERHVNRLRTQYRGLRDALIDALQASALAQHLHIASKDSGIHFLLGIESERSGEELARAAAEQGVGIEALQTFYQGTSPDEGAIRWLVAGYSSLQLPQVEGCVAALERAWV